MAGPDFEGPGSPAGVGGFAGSLFFLPLHYLQAVVELVSFAFAHPYYLKQGLIFSGSLLAILASHESGHYLFCRYYGVDATLPFFIPQPPLLIPGTFGAFIRMKSPVPSRRALFDIGLAGPLAGFIVVVPIAFAGILTLHHINIPPGVTPEITFNDPLLFRLIARIFRIDLDNSAVNSFYFAAWVGLLVTSLNLMPVGQLDGGHGTFAVFGQRAHYWIGRVVFVSVIATGCDAARPSSTAGAYGASRPAAHGDRNPHVDRLRALLPASSDYDWLSVRGSSPTVREGSVLKPCAH